MTDPLYFSDLIDPALWCAFSYWLTSYLLERHAKKKASMQAQVKPAASHAQSFARSLDARPADATGGLDRTAQVATPAVPTSTREVQSA